MCFSSMVSDPQHRHGDAQHRLLSSSNGTTLWAHGKVQCRYTGNGGRDTPILAGPKTLQ
ncbi:utp-glucose-1-phosphate uridylyltransferase [Moniliophthora roreri]|nr:utp-glucose-1-phosphate uridylyltransferase [Moniliophthora roreri]